MLFNSTMTPLLEKIPRIDADTPWKNILEIYFHEFIEYCFPEISKKIDWSKNFESLNKELNAVTRGTKLGRRLADKLMKVWLKNGTETWVLFHIEVQGRRDDNFPKRMFVYNYRLSDRHEVPIISIAILTDGDPNWRPHQHRQALFGCQTEMNFLAIKILDFAKNRQDLEKNNNPFTLILLAQLTILETPKSPQAQFLTKISLTRQLYQRGLEQEHIFQLYTFIDWLVVLPESLMLKYHQETQRIEEEQQMARFITTAERVGIIKGRQEGLEQGQKGVAEILIRTLRRQFGPLSSSTTEKILRADINTLLNWEEKIADANAIEEVIN